MNATQLEFDIFTQEHKEDNTALLKQQIEQIGDSMGKVRRKVFAELCVLKKICHFLVKENVELRKAMCKINGVDQENGEGELLFKLFEKGNENGVD